MYFFEIIHLKNDTFDLVIFGEIIGSWSAYDGKLSPVDLFDSVSIQAMPIGSLLISTCSTSLSFNDMASN